MASRKKGNSRSSNKKQRKLAREIARETGKPYQQVVEELKAALCEKCRANLGKEHLRAYEVREMFEPDEEATEGQIADYFGELYSGVGDNWTETTVEVLCPECAPKAEVARLELEARFGRPMGSILHHFANRAGPAPLEVVITSEDAPDLDEFGDEDR